jgi:hypothetical protein
MGARSLSLSAPSSCLMTGSRAGASRAKRETASVVFKEELAGASSGPQPLESLAARDIGVGRCVYFWRYDRRHA